MDDRQNAAKWYKEVFGWDFKHCDDLNYTTFSTGSLPGGYDPHIITDGNQVLIHVRSFDVKNDLDRLLSLGAKLDKEIKTIPDIVEYAIIKDPSGNRIVLLKDLAPEEIKKSGKPIVWIETPAKDPGEAAAWFNKALGWEDQYLEEMNYHMYDDGGINGAFSPISDAVKAGDIYMHNL